MKIVLPKTIAEPLTIPWFIPIPDADLIGDVRTEIREYFDYLKKRNLTPVPGNRVNTHGRYRLTSADIAIAVRIMLGRMGASLYHIEVKNLYDTSPGVNPSCTHIGYSFGMLFKVPNDRRIYKQFSSTWI